jgi:thiamine-monophosphate kinase
VRGAPKTGEGVKLGIGDDAAVLAPPRGELLVATVDAVVEGVHFDRRFTPAEIGWKALAVNLSDLAAMGARPLWALCALAAPRSTPPARLAAIGAGLARCARRHQIALVGGNVSAARDLSLTVTVLGSARADELLTRAGARRGDAILVSGTLGDAALGRRPGARAALARRQRQPIPRLELGRAIAPYASAAIDISDGLLLDLGRLCDASGVGATIRLESLPLSAAIRRAAPPRMCTGAALSGGEDYELCFTVAPRVLPAVLRAARLARCPVTDIGRIDAGKGVEVVQGGRPFRPGRAGHDHFD